MKTRVLFLIHDLGQGGAEKVLVNLVNNMDYSMFDITVMSLFGGGVNEQFLNPSIRYITAFDKVFPGNSHLMKFFSPKQLHKRYIKDEYDIEVSYLEGPCARIISGCQNPNTKLVSWIHTRYTDKKEISLSFRNEKEAVRVFNRFDYTAFVSEDVKIAFCGFLALDFQTHKGVLSNTVESEKIKRLAKEETEINFSDDVFNMIAVGSLKPVKRYDRLLSIAKKLKKERIKAHIYILGIGPLENELKKYISDNNIGNYVTLLGYDTNPYKYVSRCDLFVCSSQTEGFSTATTEALIVGTPVCTTNVSGMREMLGDNNEYGVVTENSEEALYKGIKLLLDNPNLLVYYKEKAAERGKMFSTNKTVEAVENMLLNLLI